MTNSSSVTHVQEAVTYLRKHISSSPQIGLILGSGLGVLANMIEHPTVIPYAQIPHFPQSTVEGHAGELVIGQITGKSVMIMKGRFHAYEGYPVHTVAFPVRVMKQLGIHTLIVTNAAGGINEQYKVGALMMITDHLNLTGHNPLIGANDPQFGVRFPDMSQAYSKRLRELAHQVAQQQGIDLQTGVYAGLLGPSYETPAEIRMLRFLGADAVGMSTVPEVIVARHAGIEVLGFSCISNMASGILNQPLSHQEVMDTTERIKPVFLQLILGVIAKL